MEKRNRPFTFGYGLSSHPFLETSASIVDAFIETPRAVRVWYNSDLKDTWGKQLLYCTIPPQICEHASKSLCEGELLRCGNGTAGGSRIRLSTMTTFSRVFVIVDRRRLHGVRFGQLAAYVAMVGLARLRPDARLGDAPTVLKLFQEAPHAAPAGLTDWDRTFLKSLYATDQSAIGQSGRIARAMVRAIVH